MLLFPSPLLSLACLPGRQVRLMFVPASNPAFTMFEDDLEDEDEEAELSENYGVTRQESPSESSASE